MQNALENSTVRRQMAQLKVCEASEHTFSKVSLQQPSKHSERR